MMKIPLIMFNWNGPCYARVEAFGHAVRAYALCRPVKLMGIDVLAVASVDHDWSGLSGHKMKVDYFGHGSIYRLTPIERAAFAEAVGTEAMAAFDQLTEDETVFDGERLCRGAA